MRIAIANHSKKGIESIRNIITAAAAPNYNIVWAASTASETIKKCAEDTPDLLLLDINFPDADGVKTTQRIMETSPCAILLITASVSDFAAGIFEAMRWGALDVAPVLSCDESLAADTEELLRKISLLGKWMNKPADQANEQTANKKMENGPIMVAIGASAGGPGALAAIVGNIPPDFNGTIVALQHMDLEFSASFAKWVSLKTELDVIMAQEADMPKRGTVVLAGGPGDLIIGRDGAFHYVDEQSNASFHPSIDTFFESCASNFSRPGIAVLLSGMGKDGVFGMLSLREAGWLTLAQDEATSTVYGMPKFAAEIKAADKILALNQIAPEIIKTVDDRNGNKASKQR